MFIFLINYFSNQIAMLESIANKIRLFRIFRRNNSLLEYIQRIGDDSSTIYIYPNKKDNIFVKNKSKETIDTKYRYVQYVH